MELKQLSGQREKGEVVKVVKQKKLTENWGWRKFDCRRKRPWLWKFTFMFLCSVQREQIHSEQRRGVHLRATISTLLCTSPYVSIPRWNPIKSQPSQFSQFFPSPEVDTGWARVICTRPIFTTHSC